MAGVAAVGWSFAAPQDRAWTGDRRRTTDRILDRYLDTLHGWLRRRYASAVSADPISA